MSLRDQAVADTAAILANTDHFGQDITITDPGGLSGSVKGYSNDIALVIDPQTGMVVSGRVATVVVPISGLTSAGFTSLPEGVDGLLSKPWRADFEGASFKIASTNPDRTAGVVVCFLEAYVTAD
jgi:hypothetical protein